MENYLRKIGVKYEFFELEDASTSNIASKNIDVHLEYIGKTIVFSNEKKEFFAVLISSIYKVKQSKLAKLFGYKDVRLAKPEEVLNVTGYEVGGVAPFDLNIPLYIDKELMNKEYIYVGGGDKKHLLKVRVEDIIKNNDSRIIDIPKESA